MATTSPSKLILHTMMIGTVLSGCANINSKYNVEPSYLEDEIAQTETDDKFPVADNVSDVLSIERLNAMQRNDVSLASQNELAKSFSEKESLSITVNDMTLKSYLHYAFSELLNVDYVLGSKVTKASNVTLNISNDVSPKRLFSMTQQLLQERGLGIRLNDGIYFIYPLPNKGQSNVVMGFGRTTDSIPQNAGQILQVVPLKYGVRISLERTLNGLVDAKITSDFEQSALFINGSREQIVRAIDLIRLLDVPANRGKHIALISPVYISVENFVVMATELLQTEGIEIGKAGNGNLRMIPLNQLGSVAVFSAEPELLERVEYWTEQIDKPSKGTDRQYHVYTPRFARASDLGESISPLISGKSYSATNQISSKESKNSSAISNNLSSNSVSSNDKMTLVVDKRSNTLIFHASGAEYQSILPLVRRMDVMPKQVLLSVTIAEVKLTGIFKRGFEFAFESGKFSAKTEGSFGLTGNNGIAGLVLNWASGDIDNVMAGFVDQNDQVNILSKPSLLVRDGTEANISVGDKIPITSGSTSGSTGDVITTNTSYRDTGIKLKVSPTVNSQGVVIMKITQEISNQVETATSATNPTFFDRSISTEVVAESGQTILLGGLISEDTSNSDVGVPFIKSIPILGALFEKETKSNIKTELVIMVTPKIVERSNQWNTILNKFQKGLDNITIQ